MSLNFKINYKSKKSWDNNWWKVKRRLRNRNQSWKLIFLRRSSTSTPKTTSSWKTCRSIRISTLPWMRMWLNSRRRLKVGSRNRWSGKNYNNNTIHRNKNLNPQWIKKKSNSKRRKSSIHWRCKNCSRQSPTLTWMSTNQMFKSTH